MGTDAVPNTYNNDTMNEAAGPSTPSVASSHEQANLALEEHRPTNKQSINGFL